MYHVTDVPRDRRQVHLGATSESDNMEMENVMCCHLGITVITTWREGSINHSYSRLILEKIWLIR